MLRSTLRKSTYEAIYRFLDKVSPVPYDCGALCGAACCGTEGSGQMGEVPEMGIYLLPGEEQVHDRSEGWLSWYEEDAGDYDFPDSWDGTIAFVKCKTPPVCPREKRPIQCRTFPLEPHFTKDGELVMIRCDWELPYSCPLIDGEAELSPEFIRATGTVWKHLVRDPLIRDLVLFDSEKRRDQGLEPEILHRVGKA